MSESNKTNNIPLENQEQSEMKDTSQSLQMGSYDESTADESKLDSNANANKENHVLKEPQEPVDNTLSASVKRIMSNPTIRTTSLVVGVLVISIGYGGKLILDKLNPDKPITQSSEIVVPKTQALASSTVTAEQAEYLKNKQDELGEKALKSGDTYIPPILTTREEENLDLAPPTQPGLITPAVDTYYYDKDGQKYSATKALELAAQGVEIDGVTVGKNSIKDPNKSPTETNKGKAEEPQPLRVEPYIVSEYVPGSGSGRKTEFIELQEKELTEASEKVDKWTDEYLALRLKKARMTDEKVQFTFEKQVNKLEKSFDLRGENGQRGFTTHTFEVEKEKEANNDTVQQEPSTNENSEVKPIIYAGESFRAILRSEVNTDNGTEVIATLQNGPLKGSTLMGSVAINRGNIQFNFNRLLPKKDKEISISAIARQIGTNSSGMADEINKHYLKRYTALAVSQAFKGVGESYRQTAGAEASVGDGTVVVQSSDPSNKRIAGNVVGEIGSELSNEIKDIQNTPTTYITYSGKVFMVFFNQNVLENNNQKVRR